MLVAVTADATPDCSSHTMQTQEPHRRHSPGTADYPPPRIATQCLQPRSTCPSPYSSLPVPGWTPATRGSGRQPGRRWPCGRPARSAHPHPSCLQGGEQVGSGAVCKQCAGLRQQGQPARFALLILGHPAWCRSSRHGVQLPLCCLMACAAQQQCCAKHSLAEQQQHPPVYTRPPCQLSHPVTSTRVSGPPHLTQSRPTAAA